MKHRISALLPALAMLFTLAACGKTTVELDFDAHTFAAAGETLQLTPETNAGELVWTSSDEGVATVDQNGLVTAVAPGSADITVSAGEEASAVCAVTCDWAASADLTAFYNDLAAQYGEEFPANADIVEFAMLNDLYPGLSDISTEQLLVYQPMMGAVVCEIALVEVTDAADLDAVKDILQARIDMQIEGGAFYPESIEGWEKNSRIVSNGNCVMMIAWSYCDDAVAAFDALFS